MVKRRSKAPSPAPPPTEYAAALLKQHNDARAANRKPPLRLNSALQSVASAKARESAASGILSHANLAERVKTSGYRYDALAENLAAGQGTPKAVVAGWMASPDHRANLLGSYQDLGAAGVRSAEGLWFWCAVYGSPP